jgi:hypothetical protein
MCKYFKIYKSISTDVDLEGMFEVMLTNKLGEVFAVIGDINFNPY